MSSSRKTIPGFSYLKTSKDYFHTIKPTKKNKEEEYGKTFREWLNHLGGKSVNGIPVLFPTEEAVPYHIYHKVLNAKDFGIPQNRERVFIIGIRDDSDNFFSWPKEERLTKCLKDILEIEVDGKYFLRPELISKLISNNVDTDHLIPKETSNTIRVGGGGSLSVKHSFDMIKIVGNTNPSGNGMNGKVYDSEGISPTLSTNKGEGVKVICFGRSESEKKRRREHFQKFKEDSGSFSDKKLIFKKQKYYDTILASPNPKKEGPVYDGYKIRRLTPLECFRLMGFPDEFVENARSVGISDSQLYKQSGNSIVEKVLRLVLQKINFNC